MDHEVERFLGKDSGWSSWRRKQSANNNNNNNNSNNRNANNNGNDSSHANAKGQNRSTDNAAADNEKYEYISLSTQEKVVKKFWQDKTVQDSRTRICLYTVGSIIIFLYVICMLLPHSIAATSKFNLSLHYVLSMLRTQSVFSFLVWGWMSEKLLLCGLLIQIATSIRTIESIKPLPPSQRTPNSKLTTTSSASPNHLAKASKPTVPAASPPIASSPKVYLLSVVVFIVATINALLWIPIFYTFLSDKSDPEGFSPRFVLLALPWFISVLFTLVVWNCRLRSIDINAQIIDLDGLKYRHDTA